MTNPASSLGRYRQKISAPQEPIGHVESVSENGRRSVGDRIAKGALSTFRKRHSGRRTANAGGDRVIATGIRRIV